MKIKDIADVNVKGKKVLLRIDINSPVVAGKILGNPRFKEYEKTINYLLKKEAKIAILAHQGRKGDRDFISLKQHCVMLSKYTSKKITYVDDLFGKKAADSIKNLKSGQAILLKNVRAYDDELSLSKKPNRYQYLCDKFDIFVNDAFSASHRKQGSIVLPPKYLKSYAGLSMQKEIIALQHFKINNKPTVYLIGGAKIEDYLPIFSNLKNRHNKLLASGVLANLFLAARGNNLGYESGWLQKEGYLKLLPQLKLIYKKYKSQIILPTDFAFDINGRREFTLQKAPFKYKIWDVGNGTIGLFKHHLKKSKNIFMKGPLGFSEIPMFSHGTVEILKEISKMSKNKKVFSLLGGGHLTTSISKYKIPNNFSHISLSGGALIAYISGENLPGLEALKNQYGFN